jgi:RNA polymerase sigma factor (sigma-70 family)
MNRLTDFLERERDALVGYVRRRIDDAANQDAEDIVQDVIVNLFESADPTIPIQNLAAYIYRALRNRIVDRFRRNRETVALSDRIPTPGKDPLREAEKGEMLDRIFEAMDDLDDGEKAVILATEFEGRRFRDLAAEWGIPLGTLLARKSRAMDKLRKRLTGQFNHS